MADAAEQFAQFKTLILTAGPPQLGPRSRPGVLKEKELSSALGNFFAQKKVPLRLQPLLQAAALLWHDHLAASHMISQSMETSEGSWLHGIMHRREPDYVNAKYWFRRVGRHSAFVSLAQRTGNPVWNPLAFVDTCESAMESNDQATATAVRHIQAIEFDVLVEHLLSQA